MGTVQKFVIWSLCVLCPSCRLSWAEEAKASVWSQPLLQQVRMPAGVQGGVFLPERDELVIVRPGAWDVLNKEGGREQALSPQAGTQEDPAIPLTLIGRLKLNEALRIMADVMKKDLSVGPGVEDRDVTLAFRDVPLKRALHDLLYPLGYGFKVQEEELLVLARDTRLFHLDLPPLLQGFNAVTTNESSSAAVPGGGTASTAGTDSRVRVGARVRVESSSGVMSYWQDIEENIKGLLSPAGVFSLNKGAGVAVVTDTPGDLDRIGVFLDEVNRRAARQIMVDVKVVEVSLFDEHRLGIDWSALAAYAGLQGLKVTTNFASENMAAGPVMTLTGRVDKPGSGETESGVKAVMKALGSFGRVEVVSQPRVMMLNNSVASIQVGETRSYVESTNMETTSNGGVMVSAALNQVHGGVTLQIVGSIEGDDVVLGLTPVVSTIDGIRTITLGGGNKLEAPDTSMKTMSTLVRVKAGRTVMVGGLITREKGKERQGIPLLSRLPVLGKLFSYETRRNNRTELIIFMTPQRG